MLIETSKVEDLARLAAEFEDAEPQAILRWTFDTFGDRVAVGCSFGGPGGLALVDMALELRHGVTIYYLDTDLLFDETYALVETIARRYGITPKAIGPALTLAEQAAQHGPELWKREPDRCCGLRKVAPQREFLRGYDAWVTAIRRDQAATRAATPPVMWDPRFDLVKVSPLVRWDERAAWRYLAERKIPYNPLHASGYRSIGCTPCTRPTAEGEEPRAGRWSGTGKVECGLHGAGPGAGI
jgi:phosphoadenosine phosphosulfate reductase